MRRSSLGMIASIISMNLLASLPSFAEDLGMMSMGPPGQQQKILLRYSGSLQPNDTGLHQSNLSTSAPVYQQGNDSLSFNARANWFDLYPNPADFSDLYDIQLGATFTHNLEEKSFVSLNSSFGSASDKPFQDSSVDTLNLTAIYGLPGNDTGSWRLFLNYSNNRSFLSGVPLPGFAYLYSPVKTVKAVLGVPFGTLYWQFANQWSLLLVAGIPWTAKAQINYSIAGPIQAYAGVDFSQTTYLKYGRSDPKDRLFYNERKTLLGIRSPLSRVLFGELETGYVFSQRFFTARSFTFSPASPTDLPASAYVRVGLSAGF